MSREYSKKDEKAREGGQAGPPETREAVMGRRKCTVLCHLGGEIEPLLQLQTAIPAESEEDSSVSSVQRQTWLRKAAGSSRPRRCGVKVG